MGRHHNYEGISHAFDVQGQGRTQNLRDDTPMNAGIRTSMFKLINQPRDKFTTQSTITTMLLDMPQHGRF